VTLRACANEYPTLAALNRDANCVDHRMGGLADCRVMDPEVGRLTRSG